MDQQENSILKFGFREKETFYFGTSLKCKSNLLENFPILWFQRSLIKIAYFIGLRTDIVQHGLLLPVLVNHLRLHASLDFFEQSIGYTFKNRSLLQLAMTHPSYKENYGTNPDHCR